MTYPTITQAPDKWPLPATRCYYHGKLMDYETAAFLMAMEAELGYQLTVVQGCYNPGGVSASAGTHDGGGVIDLAPWDWERKVHVARSLGAFAWHRPAIPGLWGEHIHMGIRNHPTLSDAAKAQQRDYDANPPRDGLAHHALDRTWHPNPKVTFKYPPKAPAAPTFRGVSINDDWANLASDVAGLVADVRPLVMGVQEGYRVDYHKVLPGRWRCKQVEQNKATAGVAVIWDRHKLQPIGRRTNDPTKRGRGIQPIAKGADTMMRSVVWCDVQFRDGIDHGNLPPAFRLASVHRPPMRDRASWPTFDAILEAWFKRSPLPVLLFTDANEHGGPSGLMDGLGSRYSWHGVDNGIDGCVTSLPVRGAKDLPKRTSDHNPVVITLG